MNDRRKRILHINTCNFGSTGNIMLGISELAKKNNYVSYVAFANSRSNRRKTVSNSLLIGSILERNLHLKLAYYTGWNGCFSTLGTKHFLKKISKIEPNIIHLHNLHNCYINLKILFDFIKERNIPTVWTLHDCWAFTGQCPHFTAVECNKWKTGCFECPQYREYPPSRVDRTVEMYALKREWFTGVKNLTLVTPSMWLRSLVSKSYLRDYEIKVINNGIDLETFKPTASDFRQLHRLEKRKVILGVSSAWSEKKGLGTFLELSHELNDEYKIVLVGLTEAQIRRLPERILRLGKTRNPHDLAEIYTASDVFLNPTLEDTFPTTNLEAIACGIPVITYDTGGGTEVINRFTGRVVTKDISFKELSVLIKEIVHNEKEGSRNERIRESSKFSSKERFSEYIVLYSAISFDND